MACHREPKDPQRQHLRRQHTLVVSGNAQTCCFYDVRLVVAVPRSGETRRQHRVEGNACHVRLESSVSTVLIPPTWLVWVAAVPDVKPHHLSPQTVRRVARSWRHDWPLDPVKAHVACWEEGDLDDFADGREERGQVHVVVVRNERDGARGQGVDGLECGRCC